MLKCQRCPVEFKPRAPWQVYCSKHCASSHWNEQCRQGGRTQKQCRVCKESRLLEQFPPRAVVCTPCEQRRASGHSLCGRCGEEKPFAEFQGRAQSWDGCNNWCKECCAAKSKTRNATPEQQAANRERKFARRYGITTERYNEMHAEQDGRCGLCHDKVEGVMPVDHCHSTKRVRKLLCRRCNLLLGYCNDDPELLRQAIDYLERHAHEVAGERTGTMAPTR